MREFDTGATRNSDEGKPDYEAYLSPLVIQRYGEYMAKHAVQADGKLRPGDNWQKGFPLSSYVKSGWRHMLDWWLLHRGYKDQAEADNIEEALCAVIFNASGYLHELLKRKQRLSTKEMIEGQRTEFASRLQETAWSALAPDLSHPVTVREPDVPDGPEDMPVSVWDGLSDCFRPGEGEL